MACKNPTRGVWGGPPGRDPWSSGAPNVKAASKIGLLPRVGALSLASFVRGAMPPESLLSSGSPVPFVVQATAAATADVSAPEGGAADASATQATATAAHDASPAPPLPQSAPLQGGCAGCSTGPSGASSSALAGFAAIAALRLRRRRR